MSRELFYSFFLFIFSHLLLCELSGVFALNGDTPKDFYIVFLRDEPMDDVETVHESHINLLSTLKGSDVDAKESHVYSYTSSFNAFAAKLHEDEANKLSGMDEVLSILPNRYLKLHTTRSWDFIGLARTARRNIKGESNIIVGLLDTGITPESESFADHEFGPPPAKWKGSCSYFANFSGCNNKLIGAKYFKLDGQPDPKDILSPVDVDGHGTHTSSTLAGNLVPDANLYGFARGTARGAVPAARIASYKVCWSTAGCSSMDLLAGFDAAVRDGVDVISISIGGLDDDYATNPISVGAFHAMKKGIITVASAGNDGPYLNTVDNIAPWMFTVGATGIDREFRSKVVLGNGKTLSGIGVNIFNPKQKLYPLVGGEAVAKNSANKENARSCIEEGMDARKVKGKLVLCELLVFGSEATVKKLGGIGAIIQSDTYLDTPSVYETPATMVNYTLGAAIGRYINSTRTPSAVIEKSQEIRIKAPFVASFSSRGPNLVSDNILKPDITAPGIAILASFSPLRSVTGLEGDTLHSNFNFLSGTSMACPHVSGAAAYVKSFHPNWSPAAIKSAIMTTATPLSPKVNIDGEFAYGAGQLNPVRALSPGLIYDIDDISYIRFLCHEGYNRSAIAVLVGSRSINCSALLPGAGHDALNYPTIQFGLENRRDPATGVFRRTVTNVGPSPATYNATVRAPKGVDITVHPMSLTFSAAGQKRSFKVVVKAKPAPTGLLLRSGSLIWRSSRHAVRSPIVIYNIHPQD